MQPIIITLEGGVIQDIKNIPFGIEIRVKDFDIQNADEEDLVEDGLGNAYVESVWNSDQEEPNPYQELLFLEHKGIKVYHTYWNDNNISEYWYTLYPEVSEDGQFDIRDLKTEVDDALLKGKDSLDIDRIIIRSAIDAGELKRTDEA